jgi:ribosomal protein L11 methyltransferase
MFVWSRSIAVAAEREWEERLAAVPGVHLVTTSEPGKARVRLEVYGGNRKDLDALRHQWQGSIREIKEQNWAALSAAGMPEIPVRGRLVICDARTEEDLAAARMRFPNRHVIAVPADMAFGTGHHATTASVLRMLVDCATALKGRRWSLADLGCGSGILAIAAVKLGAAQVWGCDFDAKAVAVARENASRNGTPNIRFTKTDVLKWAPKEEYDVVAANIFFDILHAAAPQIVHTVRPGGKLMVSGILKSQADECLDALTAHGVVWERVVRKGKWVSALGVRA